MIPKSGDRFSDKIMRNASRLRAVVAFDNDDIGGGMWQPYFEVLLIFRRAVAGERCGVVEKFDHHIARARRALRALELARAYDEAPAKFLEDRGIGGGIGLVALLVLHIDAADPVAFRHLAPPRYFFACSISVIIAFAAAFGSAASTTGRPTTR